MTGGPSPAVLELLPPVHDAIGGSIQILACLAYLKCMYFLSVTFGACSILKFTATSGAYF